MLIKDTLVNKNTFSIKFIFGNLIIAPTYFESLWFILLFTKPNLL